MAGAGGEISASCALRRAAISKLKYVKQRKKTIQQLKPSTTKPVKNKQLAEVKVTRSQ
jgi:hypothetical protein